MQVLVSSTLIPTQKENICLTFNGYISPLKSGSTTARSTSEDPGPSILQRLKTNKKLVELRKLDFFYSSLNTLLLILKQFIMKNLKILTFGILLAGIYLTSCKKEADRQPQQGTPPENTAKLFEKSLTIYNADKTNSTTLRFRSASKTQLDKMALENMDFTLVETPEALTEAPGLTAPTIAGEKGISSYSGKNATLSQSMSEKQVLPADAIQVDLPLESKTKPFSIEVKSRNLNNGTLRPEQAATTYYWNFYYKSLWHKIQVTNLNPNPIHVYFYNYTFQWNYTGINYWLYQNGWAWYCNTFWTAGAGVSHPDYYYYRINYWLFC